MARRKTRCSGCCQPWKERSRASPTSSNDKAARFHWPTYPFTKASYACYLPGQWTTIAGAEIKPVGNLYFAGEHCSRDFQGFMNGGAETGKQVAQELRRVLRRWRPANVGA